MKVWFFQHIRGHTIYCSELPLVRSGSEHWQFPPKMGEIYRLDPTSPEWEFINSKLSPPKSGDRTYVWEADL